MEYFRYNNSLTLLSDQGTFTPVDAQGGGVRKLLSHRNFAMTFARYIYGL